MMLSAPGASEQMVDVPLALLRKALKELGGPENYSETEEYDYVVEMEETAEAVAEEECVAAGEEDQATVDAVAAGLSLTEDEARNQLAYVENDATWVEEAASVLDPANFSRAERLVTTLMRRFGLTEAQARKQLSHVENEPAWLAEDSTDPTLLPDPEPEEDEATEEHVAVAYDGLYDEGWAERDDYGPSLKKLHRALVGAGDTGPDGIPRPEQLIPAEEEVMMPGGLITARKEGEADMKFGYRVNAEVKKALEGAGYTFTHTDVAIEASGKVTIQNVNGRLVRSAGGLLTVSKGNRSFKAKSVSVEYAKAGWHIS